MNPMAGTEGLEVTLQFIDDVTELPIPLLDPALLELRSKAPKSAAVAVAVFTIVGDGSTGEVTFRIDTPVRGKYIASGRILQENPAGKYPSTELRITVDPGLFE